MVLHPGPKGKGKCWECLRCQFPRRGCSTELATFCHAESKGPAKNTHVIARPKAVAIRFPFHAKHGPSPKGTEEERIATSAYGLLAMTRKIEPGPSFGGAVRTPREGCPYGRLVGRSACGRPCAGTQKEPAQKENTSLRGPQARGNPRNRAESTIGSPSKIEGIATPVCALVRNDVFFFRRLPP